MTRPSTTSAIRKHAFEATVRTRKEAIHAIYRWSGRRSSSFPSRRKATSTASCFKSIRKYDLTKVGRFKITASLQPFFEALAERKDFLIRDSNDRRPARSPARTSSRRSSISSFSNKRDPDLRAEGADHQDRDATTIDHLGNRRIRSVGELMENQIRAALAQMARLVRERSTSRKICSSRPARSVNASPVVAAVRPASSGPASSPNSWIRRTLVGDDHKRRLSALGPGGLNRKRAGFEVPGRPPHALRAPVSHRNPGRPEHRPHHVPGLFRPDQFLRPDRNALPEGLPRPRDRRGRSTSRPTRKTNSFIAQANAPLDKKRQVHGGPHRLPFQGRLPPEASRGHRLHGHLSRPGRFHSAALIPFLEHDDANRALYGLQHAAPGRAAPVSGAAVRGDRG